MAIPAGLAMLVGLGPIVVPLARRVLFGLGFGLVTYVGISALFDTIKAQIITYMGGAPASILALLSIAKVDVALSLVLSAIGIKIGFMGLNAAGNLVRPRWKWNDE